MQHQFFKEWQFFEIYNVFPEFLNFNPIVCFIAASTKKSSYDHNSNFVGNIKQIFS